MHQLAAIAAAVGFAVLGSYDLAIGDLHCAGHAFCGTLVALVEYARIPDSPAQPPPDRRAQ